MDDDKKFFSVKDKLKDPVVNYTSNIPNSYISYKDQLKSPEWIELSEEVKDYYGHTCCGCGGNDNLHTHHKRYFKNRMAWEYDVDDLVCLCASCHSLFHENLETFKNTITNHRLYYSYEFDKITKMVDLVCDIDTNHYSKIINYLESLTEEGF